MLRRKIALFCAVVFLMILLSSCRQTAATAEDVVNAMCAAEAPLPAGKIYVLSAPEDSEKHLSSDLLTATFGNGNYPPEMDLVADAAMFFSYSHPCELVAFHCKTADGTDAVAKLCLRRLDVLKNYRNTYNITQNTDASYFDNATVTVRGRWVILCVSSDPAAAIRAFRRVL